MESPPVTYSTKALTPYQQQSYSTSTTCSSSSNNLIPSNRRLLNLKIKTIEFSQIIDFATQLPPLNDNTIFKKNQTNLAFSIACIQEVDKLCIFILLKKHRIDQLAQGTYSSITLAWDVNSRKLVICKSASKEFISPTEIEINKLLSGRQEFAVTSRIFEYEGPIKGRREPFEPNYVEVSKSKSKKLPLHNSFGNDTPVKDALTPLIKSPDPSEKKVNGPKIAFILDRELVSIGGYFDIKGNSMPAKDFYSIVRQIFINVSVLHNKFGIVHLDLKPDNILMTKHFIPKIADFGNATYMGKDVLKGGSLYFLAPEMIGKFDLNNSAIEKLVADPSADIWSLGMTLVRLISDEQMKNDHRDFVEKLYMPKVEGKLAQKVERKILLTHFLECLRKNLHERHSRNNNNFKFVRILPLIRMCLKIDPTERIKIAEAIGILEIMINSTFPLQNNRIY